MADNLKLQQDINAAIAQRNKLLEDGEKHIKNQAQLFAALNDVISQKKSLEQINEILQKLQAVGDNIKKLGDDAETGNDKLTKSFTVAADEVELTSQKVSAFSDKVQKDMPSAFDVAGAAVSGFVTGLKNIFAIGKSAVHILTSIAGAAFNVGKSILSIPFKIFDGLIDKATSGGGGNELAQAYENVRKEFGSFKQDVSKNVIESARSMRGELANTGLSVWRVMGNLADRLKAVTELAKGMGPIFHRFGTEIAKSAEEVVAYEKGLGLSAEQMKAVGERAATFGTDFTEQLRQIGNFSLQLGDDFGVSSKLISRDVGTMIKDVKHFGSLSVKEMSSISVWTRKLGFEFTKLQGLIEKFDTFEDAAEASAKLSQAFGVQVNAFEMMKQQDPAKRLDDLRKAFQAAGKSADGMSRQELKLLAQTTGLDEETAKLGLSSKNMGLSYDEVQKKADAAGKKQLSQTEVLKKLADSIERLVMMGDISKKGFWGQFFEGIERGVQSSPEFIKLMFGIRNALRETMMIGVDLGRSLVKLIPGIGGSLGDIKDAFAAVPSFFRGLSEDIKNFLGPGNTKTVGQFIDGVQNRFSSLFGKESAIFAKLAPNVQKFMIFLSEKFAEGFKYIIPKLTEGLKFISKFISNPKEFAKNFKMDNSVASKFLQPIIDPLIAVASDTKMWQGLWNALKDVLSKVGSFILNEIKKIKIPTSVWIAFGAMLFGPALGNSLIAIGTAALSGYIKKIFIESAAKAVAEKTATAALSQTTQGMFQNGISSGMSSAFSAIKTSASGLWTKLIPFVTTIPSGAAAAGAAAIGASLAAIAAAGYAAYSTNAAASSQADAQKAFSKSQLAAANVMSKRVPVETKKAFIEAQDAQIKALEDAKKERQSSLFGFGDLGRELTETVFGKKGASTEDLIAKMRTQRNQIVSQVEVLDKEAAKKAEASEAKKRILDALGPITIENAAERLQKIDSLVKTVTSKNFDIAGSIKTIQDSLENVDFNIFKDKTKEDQINQSLATLQSVKALIATMTDISVLTQKAAGSISGMSLFTKVIQDFGSALETATPILQRSMGFIYQLSNYADGAAQNIEKLSILNRLFDVTKDLGKNLQAGVVQKSFDGVFEMVKQINVLQTSLEQMTAKPINLVGQLRELSTRLGLGANQKFSISNNGVNINIDLKVTMEAGKVEEVILQRKDSKIRKTFDVVPGDKAAKEAALGPAKVL